MNFLRSEDLVILVTLPSDQNDIAWPGRPERGSNRLSSIRFDPIATASFWFRVSNFFGNRRFGSWTPPLGKTAFPYSHLDLA